jgi:hypothetical protein
MLNGWNYWVKSVTDSTEPANYRSSYSSASNEVVDIKITMCQSASTIVTTAIELLLLLKLTVSEEQEEGGLRSYTVF